MHLRTQAVITSNFHYTCMQKVVGVQLPKCSVAMLRYKVAQKQVDGVLLLSVRVGIAVEAADGGHEVPGLRCGLPVAPLPLKEGRVGFRPSILHARTHALEQISELIPPRIHRHSQMRFLDWLTA